MSEHLPVIHLELNSGVFRIKTEQAIYEITVKTSGSLTPLVEKVVERAAPAPAPPPQAPPTAPPQVDSDFFFREVSEELYSEIGRLARQLSLSIKEIPGSTFHGLDIKQTGIELEDAKGQLEDIVQMTEKATMDIMDLAETIQDDLQTVESGLGGLLSMNFMARGKTEEIDWDAAADIPADFGEGLDDLAGADLGGTEEPDGDLGGLTDGHWDQLMEQAGRLKEALAGLPVFQAPSPAAASTPAPAAKPVVKTVKKYDFNLDVVFQTMYELCTNETVKDHIKAMRADQNKAFDTQMILKSLSDTAPTTPVEDTFYNFSIAAILKTLFQATNNEKFKAVLKKMNQTTGTIFLDAILPIEGSVTEERIAETPAAAPTVPAALAPAARPGLTADTIGQLSQLAEELLTALEEHRRLQEEEPQLPDLPDEAMLPDSSQVSSEDRDRIVYSVARANDTVRRIMGSVTRILEALSFQDLSGQRIFKIVKLISDVQVQLLTLLVSYGAKIKQKKEDQVTSRQDQEKLAQNEVDRMLERVALGPSELVGPGADGRLNQDAVDSLLGDLGF